MKRIAILALCLALLLSGCLVELPQGGVPAEKAVAGAGAGPAGRYEYTLVVSNRAEDRVVEGAALFCDKMGELTDGRVQVRLVYSADPAATLQAGDAQLAVLSSKEDYAGSALLEASATPFLYSSYLNFTMKANADSTLNFLAMELAEENMRPLGAFYQGATHLLGDFGAENYQQYEGMVVAVDPASGSEAAFNVLDAGTVEVAALGQRLQMLEVEEVNAAEFRLEQLSLVDFDQMSWLCLTLTCHSIIPAWLVMDAGLYDTLGAVDRAVLTEACAYMTSAVDEAYTNPEREWVERLLDQDVVVVDEVIGTRNRVRNNNYGVIWEIAHPENAQSIQQFLSLLNSLA